MPIRREHRFFYPIDWGELSAVIRFGRARAAVRRVAGRRGKLFCLDDGRWWDAEAVSWRDGAGRIVCLSIGADDVLGTVRTTRVVLATAHRNHDTDNNTDRNLAAWCQRYQMIHDRLEHQRRR